MKGKGFVSFTRLAASLAAILGFASAAGIARAGSYSNDFSAAVLTGGTLYGSAIRAPGGGLANNGIIALTSGNPNLTGAVVLAELDGGAAVTAFTAKFKAYAFGSSPTGGEGFSFNFASNLPAVAFGEQGAGTGLTVSFDTLDSGGGEAPAIDVFFNGALIGHSDTNPRTGDALLDVFVELHPDGSLDLTYNGVAIFGGLPTGYSPNSGSFGWGARTGADRHWIDDVEIQTTTAGVVIPEPSTSLLVALAMVGLVALRKR